MGVPRQWNVSVHKTMLCNVGVPDAGLHDHHMYFSTHLCLDMGVVPLSTLGYSWHRALQGNLGLWPMI